MILTATGKTRPPTCGSFGDRLGMGTARLAIDPSSSIALHEQVAATLRRAIADGEARPGEACRPLVISRNVSRAGVTYATGDAIPTGTGQLELVLTRRIHPLWPGRYILTLRSRHGGRRILERTAITIT